MVTIWKYDLQLIKEQHLMLTFDKKADAVTIAIQVYNDTIHILTVSNII